jgi:hypothetical protein
MTVNLSSLTRPEIERAWREAAERVGFRVERTTEAYATSAGGVISIGADETLDGDDALAQLVFHELCHAITEGDGGLGRPDWGLDNVPEHTVREHACLRLQAEIAGRFGLREPMAPTTPYRTYYRALPADPMSDDGGGAGDGDPAAAIAREALRRFDASPWRGPIEDALALSAAAARDAAGQHPLGFGLGPARETCGSCAWLYVGGRGPAVSRCRQSALAAGDGARTQPETRACARWEPPVDCRTCGACCREAYHSVTVSMRDPVVWKEPDLIVRHGHRFEIRREGPRCAALAEKPAGAFSCTIYDNRPRPCREFEAGGRHCLDARRRVGLSARAS